MVKPESVPVSCWRGYHQRGETGIRSNGQNPSSRGCSPPPVENYFPAGEVVRVAWFVRNVSNAVGGYTPIDQRRMGLDCRSAEKNKRHGRTYRVVALPLELEKNFIQWMERATEGEPMVFSGMQKKTNFSEVLKDPIRKVGQDEWQNPWYNLRKSFCTDLIQVVTDIPTYERIGDHSYKMAVKHYQIMTGGAFGHRDETGVGGFGFDGTSRGKRA